LHEAGAGSAGKEGRAITITASAQRSVSHSSRNKQKSQQYYHNNSSTTPPSTQGAGKPCIKPKSAEAQKNHTALLPQQLTCDIPDVCNAVVAVCV
jgi:hypothetical protein